MTATPLLLRSIDDYLGPSEGRFFGGGYRRARYQVGDVRITAEGAASGTAATVSIGYPADWSRKAKSVDLRPHLSTVDMLVLGLQLSEGHLVRAHGLDRALRGEAWVRKVTLRAGATPQEDLDGMASSAKPVSTTPVPGSDGLYVSVYDAAVGAMRARYEIEHRIGAAAPAGPAVFATLDDALGAASGRYYGAGFQQQRQQIEDVHVDLPGLSSSATVRIGTADGGEPAAGGLEGAHHPSVSVIDCFVVNLQLAQIMMYEMDAVRRQDSNTLWMVRTVLECTDPRRPWTDTLTASARIAEKYLVPLRGQTWRNVQIQGECGGVTLRAAFAHELPAEAAADAVA